MEGNLGVSLPREEVGGRSSLLPFLMYLLRFLHACDLLSLSLPFKPLPSRLSIILMNTVEPCSMDTRLIRTPALYGQFRLSQQKAHIFSLKLTRFIRTPVNTDNGHLSVSRVTNSHILSTLLYGHWLSAHCLFS